MKLTRLTAREWALPLLMLAFVGLAVTFLAPIFNAGSRWLVLLAVTVYLLVRGTLFRPFRTGVGQAILLFMAWCLATTLWSELPQLSLLKSVAFIITASSTMAAGALWVRTHPRQEALSFLLPLALVALAAGVLGRFTTGGEVHLSEEVTLYQGAVEGANMFGSMLAMCTPLLVWNVYRSGTNRARRSFWLLLLAACVFYLLAAKSRSAFLAVMFTLLAFFLGFSVRRKFVLIIAAVALGIAAQVLVPRLFSTIEREYIIKHGTQADDVLFSRRLAWEQSYEQALKGGWIGGGYGVTIGDESFQAGGFTTVGYGREKANSQLAIVEETGLIGLALYGVVVVTLLATLYRGVRAQQTQRDRLQLLLISGMLTGMLALSVFEAWWVSPSSPESVYFWTLTGVALGICTAPRSRRQPEAPGPLQGPLGPTSGALPQVGRR